MLITNHFRVLLYYWYKLWGQLTLDVARILTLLDTRHINRGSKISRSPLWLSSGQLPLAAVVKIGRAEYIISFYAIVTNYNGPFAVDFARNDVATHIKRENTELALRSNWLSSGHIRGRSITVTCVVCMNRVYFLLYYRYQLEWVISSGYCLYWRRYSHEGNEIRS